MGLKSTAAGNANAAEGNVAQGQWFSLSRAFNPQLQARSLFLRLGFGWKFEHSSGVPWKDGPELAAMQSVEDGESPLVVLENFDGVSLGAILERETVTPERALVILRQVAAALDRLHQCNLSHGALKPASILVGAGDAVRIVDWIVHWNRLPLKYLADAAEYLAPERLAQAKADARADRFALGVIAHQLLEGRHPFAGAGLAEKLFRIRYGMADQDVFGQTHLTARAVYDRLLSADPADRYESCAAAVEELDKAPRRRSYNETRLMEPEGAPEETRFEIGSGPEAAQEAVSAPLSRWWALAAVLALLAFGLGVLNWRVQGRIDDLAAQAGRVAGGNHASTLEDGRMQVCNVSPDAMEIRELAVAYWNADHQLNVFNSTAYTQAGWVVAPGSVQSLDWPPGDTTVWNGSALFYFALVREGQKEFVVSGRWDGNAPSCLHLSRSRDPAVRPIA
jgi:Protein kinase domain